MLLVDVVNVVLPLCSSVLNTLPVRSMVEMGEFKCVRGLVCVCVCVCVGIFSMFSRSTYTIRQQLHFSLLRVYRITCSDVIYLPITELEDHNR